MNSNDYRHPSDVPSIMHLKMVDKEQHHWGDDHTSTMLMKKHAMSQGIELSRPINYKPHHVRSVTGFLISVALSGLLFGIGYLIVVFLLRHLQ